MSQGIAYPAVRLFRAPGRQPVGQPAIDRSDPLSRSLMGLWVANGGRDLINLMNGITAPHSHYASLLGVVGIGGRCIEQGTGGGSWDLGPANTVYAGSSSFGLVRRKTGANASTSAFGDASLNVHLPWSDNTVYWDYPSSVDRTTFGIGAADNLLDTFLLTGGAAGRSMWWRGIKRTLSGNPTTTASPGSGSFTLNASGASGPDNQEIYLFATWGRQLTDPEAQRWSNDPYCLVRSTQYPLVGVAAAGGSLRFNSSLNGLGGSGRFFHDRLAAGPER